MHHFTKETFLLSENAEDGATRERSSKDADEILKNSTERYDSQNSIFMSSKLSNEHLKEEDKDLSTVQAVYKGNVSDPLKELDLTFLAKVNNIGHHSFLPAQDALESEITNSFFIDEELMRHDQDHAHSQDNDEAELLPLHLTSPGQGSKSPKGIMGETNQVISSTEEKNSQNSSQTTVGAQPGVQVAANNAEEGSAHVESSPFPCSGIEIRIICIICGCALFMSIYIVIHLISTIILCIKAILCFVLITFVLSLWITVNYQEERKQSDEQNKDLDAERENIVNYRKNRSTETDFRHEKKLQKKNYPLWKAGDTCVGPKDASILQSRGTWPFQLTDYAKMINLRVPVLFEGLYQTFFDETFIVGPKTHGHTLYPHESAKLKTAGFQSAEWTQSNICGKSELGVLTVGVNPVIPSSVPVNSKNANNCIEIQPKNDEKHDWSSSIPPSANSNNPQAVYKADFSPRIPETRHNNIPLSEKLTEGRRPRPSQETVEYYLERTPKIGGGKPAPGNHAPSRAIEEVCNSYKSDIDVSGGPAEGSEPKQEERRETNTENYTNNGGNGARSGDQGARADRRGSNNSRTGNYGDDDDDDDEENRNRQIHVDLKPEGCRRRKLKKNRPKEDEEDNNSSFERKDETCQSDDLDDHLDVFRQLAAEHPMSRQLATRHPMSRQQATRHPMFMSRQRVTRRFLFRQLATRHLMSRQQATRNFTELILTPNSPLLLLLFQNLFSPSSRWLQNLSIITSSAGPSGVGNNCCQTTLTGQLRVGQNCYYATLTGLLRMNHNFYNTLGLGSIHTYSILSRQFRVDQNNCHATWTGISGICRTYRPAQLRWFFCELLWLLFYRLQISACPRHEEVVSWHSLPSHICFQFPLAEGSNTIYVAGDPSRETESSHVLCILSSVPSRTPSLQSFSQPTARDSHHRTYFGTRSLLLHGHNSMDAANSTIHNQYTLSSSLAFSEMLLRVLAEVSIITPLASVHCASNSIQCFQSEAGLRNRFPQRVFTETWGEISSVHSSRQNERSVHRYRDGQDSIVNGVNEITAALASQESVSQQAVIGGQRTVHHGAESLQAASSHLVQHRDDEENKQTLNEEVTRRKVHSHDMEARPSSFHGDDSSSDDIDGDVDDDSSDEAEAEADEDEAEADEDASPGLVQQFRQPCLSIRGAITVITTPENNDDEENGNSSDEEDNLYFVHPERQLPCLTLRSSVTLIAEPEELDDGYNEVHRWP